MAVVEFEWGESNRRRIAEHRVRAEEAEGVILNNPADLERQNRNGEERIPQVGRRARVASW